MTNEYGSIFLSHSSHDKPFVEKVYSRLDASSTFYDIKSVYPGQTFNDAMKAGLSGKNLFVLFHSPSTVGTWVEYEKELAETNQAKHGGRVLVVPMAGETYRSLPDWMKAFMTCTEEFSVSDIVRQIIFLQNVITSEEARSPVTFIGREELCRNIHLKAIKNLQGTGLPLQHIILSGLPGMGRASVANFLSRSTFKSMRPAGPIFSLPDMAEAVDFYLAVRQDVHGALSKQETKAHDLSI